MLASSDPTWARADLVPGPDVALDQAVVIAHKVGGAWEVADVGTSGVGCQTPPAVKADLGVDCPQ